MNDIITYAVKLATAIIGMLITYYIVPWLKDKRLYETVKQFVCAAEKLSGSIVLDKKQYVIDCLTQKGITVTSTVDALIEAAVEELDIAIGKVANKASDGNFVRDADDGYGMTE